MKIGCLFLGLLFLLSCEQSDDKPARAVLRGRVLDAAGNGVAGVGVVVSYDLPYPSLDGDTLIAYSATTTSPIWLRLNSTQPALVTVHDLETHAVLDTLLDEILEAGPHHLEWDLRDRDGRLVTADIYRVMLTIPGDQFGFVLLVNPDYPAAALPCRVLDTTDAGGAFSIEEEQLAFRHDWVFDLINPAGLPRGQWVLERNLRVHALGDDGWIASSPLVHVDPGPGSDVVVRP